MLTDVIGINCIVSLLLALLLFVAGLAHWDNDSWARGIYYAYCVSTFASLCILCLVENVLAPEDPNWGRIFLLRAILRGIYPLVLFVLLSFKKI